MSVGQKQINLILALPVRTYKHKSSIQFDFKGVAEGIKRATEMDVAIIYGYPGRYHVPEVTKAHS